MPRAAPGVAVQRIGGALGIEGRAGQRKARTGLLRLPAIFPWSSHGLPKADFWED